MLIFGVYHVSRKYNLTMCLPYNTYLIVLYLDKTRLEAILTMRGLTINKLAELCSISRQSIYNMFDSSTVFNSTFEKIRKLLNCDYRAITSDKSLAFEVLKTAPDKIKVSSYKLFEFAKNNHADLLLFSSNNTGKYGKRPEWDFAVYFQKKEQDKELKILGQKLNDDVVPYSINLININGAPIWLKQIIKNQYIRLYGHTSEDLIFSGKY